MTGLCEHCAKTGPVHQHHPTGRFRGRPVEDLTETLCEDCHVRLHRIWNANRIDDRIPTRNIIARRLLTFLAQRTEPLDPARCYQVADLLDRALADQLGDPR